MSDLFEVVTYPLKQVALLLFNLVVGSTNLGSLTITGLVFVVLIGAIMHGGNIIGRIGDLRDKRRNRNDRE